MRRTPMPQRKTPLVAKTPLKAHKPINPVSKKRQRENRQRTAVLRPMREAQQWCSVCGATGVGLDAHEVRSRARGGSITDPANIRLVCRRCHHKITTEPAWAEQEGWAA